MPNIKKLTILHSNDIHGDLIAEKIDEQLIGDNIIYSFELEQKLGNRVDAQIHWRQ